MDGTRHSRIVPRDRHWHQHMAAATHWLHLVETAACADTGHLCTRDPAWDWDRQRYTDPVGTGHPARNVSAAPQSNPRALHSARVVATHIREQNRAEVARVK